MAHPSLTLVDVHADVGGLDGQAAGVQRREGVHDVRAEARVDLLGAQPAPKWQDNDKALGISRVMTKLRSYYAFPYVVT